MRTNTGKNKFNPSFVLIKVNGRGQSFIYSLEPLSPIILFFFLYNRYFNNISRVPFIPYKKTFPDSISYDCLGMFFYE